MAKHPHQFTVAETLHSLRTLAKGKVAVTGQIQEIIIDSDLVNGTAGNIAVVLKINGAIVRTSNVATGQHGIDETGLTIAVNKFDNFEVLLGTNLPSLQFFGNNLYYEFIVEDGQAVQGPQGDQGDPGPQGDPGDDGADGVGLPVGGATGQIPRKNSATDFDTGWFEIPAELEYALGDESTAITTGTKLITRIRHAMKVASVRLSLTVASSSGIVEVDVKQGGTSIFTTKVSCDASETTSLNAASAHVLTSTPISIADDVELEFIITGAGTGAKGPKVCLKGTRL